MINKLQQFKERVLNEIKDSQNLELLENIWRKYLGRKGELRGFINQLKNLTREEKAKVGQLINEIKKEIEEAINKKKLEIGNLKLEIGEFFDLTLPGQKISYGHLHPHTQMKYQVAEIFHSMGFEILEGPELENDYYNFESLNIPEGHPARDMWDTFYIKSKISNSKSETNSKFKIQNSKLLLRTHTSAMQVRVMEKRKPPLKICVIGKCFRHEATDASHEHTLYQIEGFVVDKEISVANLIYTLKSFLNTLFGPSFAKASEGKQEVKVRLRPSYFPFTEPSFEMDFACLNCGGTGYVSRTNADNTQTNAENVSVSPHISQRKSVICSVCGGSGWVEILGCGMINPKVFAFAGYPKNKYTGFAFGVGLDRLVMLKHKIDDIRWFHSGDLRFIKQF